MERNRVSLDGVDRAAFVSNNTIIQEFFAIEKLAPADTVGRCLEWVRVFAHVP